MKKFLVVLGVVATGSVLILTVKAIKHNGSKYPDMVERAEMPFCPALSA
jgi:hypothetical protein